MAVDDTSVAVGNFKLNQIENARQFRLPGHSNLLHLSWFLSSMSSAQRKPGIFTEPLIAWASLDKNHVAIEGGLQILQSESFQEIQSPTQKKSDTIKALKKSGANTQL